MSIKPETVNEGIERKICPKCRNELEEDSLFCPKCGAEFSSTVKKDLTLEKLEEVEKAYLDLMNSYSSILSVLNLKKGYIKDPGVLVEVYSFSWDNVPGNDSERILRFLRDYLHIGWAKNAEIHKSNDGKTIRVFKGENSAEIMIDEKKKATLNISDGRTFYLNVKKKNGKLYIFPKIKYGTWLDLQKEFYKKLYDQYIIGHPIDTFIVKNFVLNIIGSRIVRWKIGRRVDLLREAFLSLIAQCRNKIDPEVIKKIEIYCEDMDKLSAQFLKSRLIVLFFAITPVVPVLINAAFKSSESVLNFWMMIFYLIVYGLYLLLLFVIPSFWFSKRLFRQENISKKERKIFVLIQEYLEFV